MTVSFRGLFTWFYSVVGTTSDRSTTGFPLLPMTGTLSMVGTVPLFSTLNRQKKLFSFEAQSRQSAKLFLQSYELGLPHLLTPQASLPSLWLGGGRVGWYTLACGRGGGAVPISTRGQTLWYSRYICTLCFEGFIYINTLVETERSTE
jgi:hypothetical protein